MPAFQKLGPYTVDGTVGRGGMGTVYRGRDAAGNVVAIKVLSATHADDEHFRARFIAEVETLKLLRHDRIVGLIGHGQQDGHLFYSMELVQGKSLQDKLTDRYKFSSLEIAQIGADICSALQHAHNHGVVHRDLKPANLLEDQPGRCKLGDFGIAKLFGASQMTADGGVIGTADYMAPEQAAGIGATVKSDLYALGSVLYALAVGEPPFRGQSLPEVIHRVRTEAPRPLTERAHHLPPPLATLIHWLLEKDPADRPATAHVVGHRMQLIITAIQNHGITMLEPHDKPPSGETRISDPPPAKNGDTYVRPDLQYADRLPEVSRDADNAKISADVDKPSSGQSSVGVSRNDLPTQDEDHASPQGDQPARAGLPNSDEPTRIAEPSEKESSDSHYTVVSDSPEKTDDEEPVSWQTILTRIVLIAVLLVLVSTAAVFVMQQSSPDDLFDEIATAASSDAAALMEVEPKVRQFIENYPDDPRIERVEEIRKQIEIAKRERQRQLDRRLAGTQDTTFESAVGIAYNAALAKETIDPQRAAAELQAIITLYQDDESAEAATIVNLARQEASRIEARLESQATMLADVVAAQLDDAVQLGEEDPLAATEKIRALLLLYENKPWAAGSVRQAHDWLREHGHRPMPPPR